jgi:hypothetical protein
MHCKKHEQEVARVFTLHKEFEEQWDANATRTRQPIEYPLEIKEVMDLEPWVKEEI